MKVLCQISLNRDMWKIDVVQMQCYLHRLHCYLIISACYVPEVICFIMKFMFPVNNYCRFSHISQFIKTNGCTWKNTWSMQIHEFSLLGRKHWIIHINLPRSGQSLISVALKLRRWCLLLQLWLNFLKVLHLFLLVRYFFKKILFYFKVKAT